MVVIALLVGILLGWGGGSPRLAPAEPATIRRGVVSALRAGISATQAPGVATVMERDWTGEIREDAWREHGIRSEPEHHRGERSKGRVESEVDGNQLMAWDERQTWARFPTSLLPVLRDGLEQL